ncbi:NUDIX domain-containing protein [Candidatus Kaiserbacteria bacterium]|nr:NUDIX domain-containing protein [Candidatus Kaiserbacteria bacterium]USN92619.1 MAG: NUDIX domain-containing protein [Candidatus Nomurabacteria bacterium]
METKKDSSYGVVPIRKKGDSWEVFLIHQYSRIGNNSYWALPKGHPESDETAIETAERELKEETGMVAEKILNEPIFDLQYSFVFDGDLIEKSVFYFIGIVTDMTQKLNGTEVKEAGWYSFDDASDKLEYQGMKNLFEEAREYIEKNMMD